MEIFINVNNLINYNFVVWTNKKICWIDFYLKQILISLLNVSEYPIIKIYPIKCITSKVHTKCLLNLDLIKFYTP